MRYSRDFRVRQPGGRRTLVQQLLATLAGFGAAADLYIPGVGAVNGTQAGNWLDSAGTTAATWSDPVGLAVSAGKKVGPELFTGAYVTGTATTAAYSGRVATVTFGGNMSANWINWLSIPKTGPATTGFTTAEFWAKWVSGGDLQAGRGYAANLTVSAGENGGIRKKYAVTAHSSTSVSGYGELSFGALVAGSVWEIEIISVRELPGAHLTQPTTANKPFLHPSGSWQFDGTNDSFASTLKPGSSGFMSAVVNRASTNVRHVFFGGGQDATSAGAGARFLTNGTFQASVANGATRQQLSTTDTLAPGTAGIASFWWGGSRLGAAINNTENDMAMSVDPTSAAQIVVGGALAVNYFDGYIGPILIMSELPTPAQRALLRRGLARFSGVAL